jgi:hypothetical protein
MGKVHAATCAHCERTVRIVNATTRKALPGDEFDDHLPEGALRWVCPYCESANERMSFARLGLRLTPQRFAR